MKTVEIPFDLWLDYVKICLQKWGFVIDEIKEYDDCFILLFNEKWWALELHKNKMILVVPFGPTQTFENHQLFEILNSIPKEK